MGERRERNINYSNKIAEVVGISLENKEFILGSWGRSDDFCRLNQQTLFLIEIEYQQRHPEMNVLKVWAYLKEHPSQKAILVQQIIDLKSVSPNRVRLCKWLGKEMSESLNGRFYYHLIENELTEQDLSSIKTCIINI